MDLTAVDDAAENQFVRSGAHSDSFIGLTDHASQGAWKWVSDGRLTWCGGDDGESNGGLYSNWANDEPEAADCGYQSFASRGYWFCRQGAAWDAARAACSAVGMSLVRVHDATENAFIRDHLQGGAWLGASDLATPGDWRWIEGDALFWSGGENGAPVGGLYVNWANGRPLGGASQDCLLTNSDGHGRWFSAPCQRQASWVCSGPVQAEPRPPELAQCAMIRHGNGSWTATACDTTGGYVCETVPPDANKHLDDLAALIRDDYRTWKPRISHLQMKDGVTVTDPFSAYGARMGLRECVDSIGLTGASRAIPASGLEEQQYSQLYKGVPVLTKGYAVLRDPATKAVRSYTGSFEHDINVATKPVITEGKGSDIARAAVSDGKKKGPAPIDGELVIYPAMQGPKHAWELAWVFAVPASASTGGYSVAVSAITGRVISLLAWSQQQPVPDCPSLDVIATPKAGAVDLSVFADPQADFLDPPDARATKLASALYPVALVSAGTSGTQNGGLALASPEIRVQCDTEVYPKIAVLDSNQAETSNGGQSYDVHIWNLADPSSVRGAGILTTAQRCLEYYAKAFHYQETPTPIPWLGLDGTGQAPVDIRMWRTTDVPMFIPTSLQNPRAGNINFPPEYYVGASLDAVCHEMAHALWFYGAPDSAYPPMAPAVATPEHRSLNEGFADIMASATELDVRKAGHGEWCIGGDRYDPRDSGCTFDLADLHNPARNDSPDCAFRNADGVTVSSQCPWDYHSPDYCTFPATCDKDANVTDGCCEYHRNGTVLSHWYWTLADPNANAHGLNGNSCKYRVDPLDATDSVLAARKVTNILFTAMRAGYMPAQPDYPAMAQATLTAASDLFGLGSDEAIRVFRAWYGVSVIEESYIPGLAAPVQPAREAELVYPWTKFAWPIHTIDPNENAWDLQVANGPFDLVTPFEKDGITSTEPRTGPNNEQFEVGVWPVALPIDTATSVRYFWRVRPNVPGGGEWNDCFSINSFVGTTHPDDVKNIEVTGELSPDPDYVYPGTVSFRWDGVRGATGYKVQVAPYPTDCDDTTDPDVIETRIDVDFAADSPPPVVASVSGIQPEEDYYINIRSIGPVKNNVGDKAEYGCYHLPFKTTKMRPPELSWPDDGSYGGYHGDYPQIEYLGWFGRDGAENFHVWLYEVNENGQCAGMVSGSPFDADWLIAPLEPMLPPLWNAAGYCWEVTSVANNGSESEPSELRSFHYWHGHPWLSPGEQGGLIDIYRTPAPLPGDIDSYGNPVTLQWDPDPLACGYGVKLGKWPWTSPVAVPDPWNCYGALSGVPDFSCDEEPEQVTFRADVSGTTLQVPGSLASQGRYCWTIWSVIADPQQPGPPWPTRCWDRQPAVKLHPIFCYTSGPKRPIPTTIKAAPDDGKFTGAEMVVEYELGYVPDGQFDYWYSTDDALWESHITPELIGDGCARAGLYFYDIEEPCTLRFTIKPDRGKSYQVWVDTYNSAEPYPHAPFDQSTLVHQEPSELLYAGDCGREGVACCADGCDSDELNCVNGTCELCGLPGNDCCPAELGFACRTADEVCANGTCTHCGDESEPCCDTSLNPCNVLGQVCAWGECRECGHENGPCCPGDLCPGGGANTPYYGECLCACGLLGQPCCAGGECGSDADLGQLVCGSDNICAVSGGSQCTLDTACDYWTDPACCPGLGCVSGLWWENKDSYPTADTSGTCTKCGGEGERCCETRVGGICTQLGLRCSRNPVGQSDICLLPCGEEGEPCCLPGTAAEFCGSGLACDATKHCHP